MPRVVANQRERFDNDELFRKLSRDMEASVYAATTQSGRAFCITTLYYLHPCRPTTWPYFFQQERRTGYFAALFFFGITVCLL